MRLGANETIDYKASRFEKDVGDVDVIFDTVGGDTLERHGVSSSHADA